MFGLESWGRLEKLGGRDDRSSTLDILRGQCLLLTPRKCGTDCWIHEPGVLGWGKQARFGSITGSYTGLQLEEAISEVQTE